MNRRDLLVQASASALALAVGNQALAADKHSHSDKSAAANTANKYAKLIASTQDCVNTGLACIRHCQKELAQGNKVMAECLQSVLELVSTCENLHQLAIYESTYTKDFAKLTGKVCADCAKICEKHAKHMEACAACFEACKACEKECANLA